MALALPGCGGESSSGPDGGGCVDGGKCDEADGTVEITCLEDHTGLGRDSFELGDAFAKLVLADGQCELGFEDTVTALVDSGKCENHRTMGVSEVAQRIDDKPPFFRTVTAMECDLGKDDDGNTLLGGVWFSLFAAPDSKPGDFDQAELIALDPVNGIFNYYDTSSGGIEFFGDSMQFIQDTRSASQAAGSSTARCAGCHRGGGLIMKELPAPWMHWEPDFSSPGHSELIGNNEELMGFESDGVELETGIVRPNNRNWNRVRISKVVAGLGTTTDMKLLLRPLFCSEDINLASNFGDSVSSGQLGGGIMVPRSISGFSSVSIKQADYDAIKKEFNQRMSSQLGSFDDTVGSLARVFRAASDVDYQDKLRGLTIDKPDGSTEKISIVDQEFIEDVLMVDFTRAIQFSGDDRCKLLDFAPDLKADELNPKAVRDGFIANLQGASSPAAKDFLSYLEDEQDDTRATVKAFENACNDRKGEEAQANGKTVSAMAKDYLSVLFHNRTRAEKEPMFEFDGMTMPQTSSFPNGTRLDPNTCQLTTSYVSPAVVTLSDPDPGRGSGGGSGSNSCVDRCGESDDAASCQCDTDCLENDDCCSDFKAECPDVTGTLSCENRCGEFNDDTTCQCDFECDDRGDCCFDWGAECMDPANVDPGPAPDPKLSCENRCGTFNPGANCQCNDLCADVGDCCPDFALECGGSQPEPAPADNCLHVAEVLYDADGSDDGAEWIKLYNSCDDDQSLTGMSIGYGGKNYTTGGFDLSGKIDGKSCIIVGGPASDGSNGEPNVTMEINFRPDLQNSGSEADGVAIFTGSFEDVTKSTVPVDAVIYGGSNSSNLLDARGETPDPHVGDAPEGSSILRTGRDSWTVSEPDPTSCPDF